MFEASQQQMKYPTVAAILILGVILCGLASMALISQCRGEEDNDGDYLVIDYEPEPELEQLEVDAMDGYEHVEADEVEEVYVHEPSRVRINPPDMNVTGGELHNLTITYTASFSSEDGDGPEAAAEWLIDTALQCIYEGGEVLESDISVHYEEPDPDDPDGEGVYVWDCWVRCYWP